MATKKIIRPAFTQPEKSPLQPHDKLNEAKLYMMLKGMSVSQAQELLSLSWEEAFMLAADAEKFVRQMSAGDIALQHFASQQDNFLKLAEMLERREKYIHLLE